MNPKFRASEITIRSVLNGYTLKIEGRDEPTEDNRYPLSRYETIVATSLDEVKATIDQYLGV